MAASSRSGTIDEAILGFNSLCSLVNLVSSSPSHPREVLLAGEALWPQGWIEDQEQNIPYFDSIFTVLIPCKCLDSRAAFITWKLQGAVICMGAWARIAAELHDRGKCIPSRPRMTFAFLLQ